MSALSILNAIRERPLSAGRFGTASARFWPVRDLRLKGRGPGSRASIYPYVAPHTAKIHTLITLGLCIRTKLLFLKPQKRLPCGFDSHRPLHSPRGAALSFICLRERSEHRKRLLNRPC
jgi:hypothetical protein